MKLNEITIESLKTLSDEDLKVLQSEAVNIVKEADGVKTKLTEMSKEILKANEDLKAKDAAISEHKTASEKYAKEKSELETAKIELEKLKAEDTGKYGKLIADKEKEIETLKNQSNATLAEKTALQKEVENYKSVVEEIKTKNEKKKDAIMKTFEEMKDARPELLVIAKDINTLEALEAFAESIQGVPTFKKKLGDNNNTGITLNPNDKDFNDKSRELFNKDPKQWKIAMDKLKNKQ